MLIFEVTIREIGFVWRKYMDQRPMIFDCRFSICDLRKNQPEIRNNNSSIYSHSESSKLVIGNEPELIGDNFSSAFWRVTLVV